MIGISDAYELRPVRFHDIWEFDEWTLKVYTITYSGQEPGSLLLETAYEVTERRLRTSAAGTNHYGLGFVGIHAGKTGNFVFVDWWADENELHHHVYISPSSQPAKLQYVTPTGLAACVWDLYLIGHERNAWVEHVLKRFPEPDLQGYLAARLNEDV